MGDADRAIRFLSKCTRGKTVVSKAGCKDNSGAKWNRGKRDERVDFYDSTCNDHVGVE